MEHRPRPEEHGLPPENVVLPEVWLSSHLEEAGMAQKKHKPEEIVAKLQQVDVAVSQGQSVAEALRSISVTQFTVSGKPGPFRACSSRA